MEIRVKGTFRMVSDQKAVAVPVYFCRSFQVLICSLKNQVEREKLMTEEVATKSVMVKSEMDKSLIRMEEDNMDLQKQMNGLQSQLADAEQQHAQR